MAPNQTMKPNLAAKISAGGHKLICRWIKQHEKFNSVKRWQHAEKEKGRTEGFIGGIFILASSVNQITLHL